MTGVRAALFLATCERYIGLLLSLATLSIVSRLLTPSEVGIAAIGWAILSIPYALRDLGTMDFIIQRKDLTDAEIRTAATLCMLASILLVGIVLYAAPTLAVAYGEPRVGHFLIVMVFAAMTDAVANPIIGLMRRDLEFQNVVLVNLALSSVTAFTTIGLAFAGYSYMSVAWAGVLGNAAAAGLAVWFRPNLRIFRPGISEWREVMGFGLYYCSMATMMRAYEALPYLALGRFLKPADTGYFNRALQTCQLPDKVLLAGITSIAFPTLAAEVREGRQLKPIYLHAIELITAVQWPALMMLAILAPRVVAILFGDQWIETVPLMQIMAIASMVGAVASLNYPMLYALGHPRIAFISTMLSLPLSALVIMLAASQGRTVLAASMFVTIPFNNAIALHFILRSIDLTWRELWHGLRKSALVCLTAMTGPLAVMAANDFTLDLPLSLQGLMVVLGAIGWLVGLRWSDHGLLAEFGVAVNALRQARLSAIAQPSPGTKQP